MKIETFEDREVWQQARELVRQIEAMTRPDAVARGYALRDQIRPLAISDMSEIAKGFERTGNRAFVRFPNISKVPAELRTQLYRAGDLDYGDELIFLELKKALILISRQLAGFLRYLKTSTRRI